MPLAFCLLPIFTRKLILHDYLAGIEIEEGADKYAYRQGLFVLAQRGENVAILNDTEFQPKTW